MAALGWLLNLGFAGGLPAEASATTFLRGTVTVFPTLAGAVDVSPSLAGRVTTFPTLEGAVTVGDV